MTPLETYLTRVREIRSAGGGQVETSYYGALENLFNEYGKSLKPKVMCVIQMQNQGAGMPDGGFYTADQYKKGASDQPLRGQMPARGVIEVKSPKPGVDTIAESEQVSDYLAKYGQVLVTNLREFLLVGRGRDGKATRLESPFVLAPSESEFWSDTVAHPRRAAERHATQFGEFITRAMLHASPLAAPVDVAWFLASYARDAKSRVEKAELPALTGIRTALEQALGMKFEGEKGEHFFRSTLVQTLFYGLFSAWVLWHKRTAKNTPVIPTGAERAAFSGVEGPAFQQQFNWHEAIWNLKVPMIRSLFEQLAVPTKLGPLGLVEVMDWATAVLNRVDRAVFFQHFQLGHAVQYFYEPFLEAFDPELRKQLGVWYTPPEIVQYMVARVDTVLREELKIEDGLADPRVYVLDPCCGTGAYLVEVLNHIHKTLETKGIGAMAAHELKKAAIERVFGFEILSAPFVVSHLQLGLLLENLGAPLSEKTQERPGVYLTNALTGWEPPQGPKQHLIFPEMEEERDRADEVKQQKPILVILGNPPYNGFAGIAMGEERELSNAYRTAKLVAAPEGHGLNELYVRFYRAAERKIVEGTREGIVCFISNYSWLDGMSYTGMRERYIEVFDRIWIDNLHGDRIISEYAPDGRTSETVFAIAGTSPGIKPGTSINLLAVKSGHVTNSNAELLYRDFHQAKASERRASLLDSLTCDSSYPYDRLSPSVELGLPFKPRLLGASYLLWPQLVELFPSSFPGVKTSRDSALVDIDRDQLIARMRSYCDPKVTHDAMRTLAPRVMEDAPRFDAIKTRDYLVSRGFLEENVIRYNYRPFDVRWLYWEPETKLLDEKRAEYRAQIFDRNWCLVSQEKPRRQWSQPQFIRNIGCLDLMDRGANCFPVLLRTPEGHNGLLQYSSTESQDDNRHNLSERAEGYLFDISQQVGEDLPLHVMAILYAPSYVRENEGALHQDWPRIPLPESKLQLQFSAALGHKIADLLDIECPVKGITTGKLRSEMPVIAVATGELKKPDDFKLSAGWGHGGKDGVTMPGKGRVQERDYTAAEREAMNAGAAALGLSTEQVFAQLGERTCDIFINNDAWWSNVPVKVWEYTIGGYQVIKKWLSYREFALLGRPLKPEEVSEVMNMARRIAAILLMQPDLDANYEAVKKSTYDWQAAKQSPEPIST